MTRNITVRARASAARAAVNLSVVREAVPRIFAGKRDVNVKEENDANNHRKSNLALRNVTNYGEQPIIRVSLREGGSRALPGERDRDSGSKCHERLTVAERVRVKLGFSFARCIAEHRQFNDLANSDGLFHY